MTRSLTHIDANHSSETVVDVVVLDKTKEATTYKADPNKKIGPVTLPFNVHHLPDLRQQIQICSSMKKMQYVNGSKHLRMNREYPVQ